MVMEYMKNRAQLESDKSIEDRPKWVSERNASLKAWMYAEELKKEKVLYIKRHNKITDYLTQKTYQIKGSEVANALNLNRATLMNTSSYSKNFAAYLNGINAELEDAKVKKLEKSRKSPSRGAIKNSKDELIQANKKLKERVDQLETQKTEELVRYAFDQLALPVRKKLGID